MTSGERNSGAADGLPSCRSDAVSWLTVAQMREVDRVAIEVGLTLTRMMENAGANLAWLARAMLGGDVSARRYLPGAEGTAVVASLRLGA
jgi:hypothetical protein